MTIVELREKRAKLWDTMEGFLDTHRNDKGVLSTEDDAVYANMEKELNDLTNEVRRMERRDAIAAEPAKPMSSPITEQPQKATGEAKTGRASKRLPRGLWSAPAWQAYAPQCALRGCGCQRRLSRPHRV